MAPLLYSPRHLPLRVIDLVPGAPAPDRSLASSFAGVVHGRVHDAIGRFVNDRRALLALLVPGEACLAGPVALSVVHGPFGAPALPPELLLGADIACTSDAFDKLKAHLCERENYECLLEAPALALSGHAPLRWVRDVAYLCNGDRRVTLIVPVSESPVLWVSQSWTTLMMAYITSDGVSDPYPNLTFSSIGLVTPSWLSSTGDILPELDQLIATFRQCGFTFFTRYDSISFTEYPQLALDTSYMPRRQRMPEDSLSYTVAFWDGPRETVSTPFRKIGYNVTWSLGGHDSHTLDHGSATLCHWDCVAPGEVWTYRPGEQTGGEVAVHPLRFAPNWEHALPWCPDESFIEDDEPSSDDSLLWYIGPSWGDSWGDESTSVERPSSRGGGTLAEDGGPPDDGGWSWGEASTSSEGRSSSGGAKDGGGDGGEDGGGPPDVSDWSWDEELTSSDRPARVDSAAVRAMVNQIFSLSRPMPDDDMSSSDEDVLL